MFILQNLVSNLRKNYESKKNKIAGSEESTWRLRVVNYADVMRRLLQSKDYCPSVIRRHRVASGANLKTQLHNLTKLLPLDCQTNLLETFTLNFIHYIDELFQLNDSVGTHDHE